MHQFFAGDKIYYVECFRTIHGDVCGLFFDFKDNGFVIHGDKPTFDNFFS
jgi:hypothetical protein